jgi:hypothetical protein
MSNPEAEVLIELSEELIWAFVRQQLSIVREISDRMKVGDFRFGMESAIDEFDVRLTQAAFNCSMAEKA